jgi:hypothetical protein
VYTVHDGDKLSLEKHISLDTAGIFDMRWLSSAPDSPSIALATSDGRISLVTNRTDALEVGTMSKQKDRCSKGVHNAKTER